MADIISITSSHCEYHYLTEEITNFLLVTEGLMLSQVLESLSWAFPHPFICHTGASIVQLPSFLELDRHLSITPNGLQTTYSFSYLWGNICLIAVNDLNLLHYHQNVMTPMSSPWRQGKKIFNGRLTTGSHGREPASSNSVKLWKQRLKLVI